MGKRELLLAAVFIVVGIAVYQVTAPAADPSRPGFSITNLISSVRREVRGRPESAEETRKATIPVPATVTELRIKLRSAPITVTGEDREDIDMEYYVRSNGYDKSEAQQLVKESTLLVDQAGALIILTGEFPEAGTQSATLTLKVPRRLSLRMDEKNATMKVDGIAGLTVGSGSGETSVMNVSGAVNVVQRGRTITLENLGSVRLNASAGAEVKLSGVAEDANLTFSSADVTAENLNGGLEVEARNSELRFEKLDKLHGIVRLNISGGELTMSGLSTEARIDARRAEIRVAMRAAAPIAIYGDGEPIELSLPPVGLRLDALARDGRISLDAGLEKAGLKVNTPDASEGGSREERLTGTVGGGGALITVRNSGGDIVLRSEATTPAEGRGSKPAGAK